MPLTFASPENSSLGSFSRPSALELMAWGLRVWDSNELNVRLNMKPADPIGEFDPE